MSLPAWLRKFFDLDEQQRETRMSETDVLATARAAVEAEGRPWQEPVRVDILPGRRGRSDIWEVLTNANMLGSNVKVWIEDQTGQVVRLWVLPR